MKTRDIALLAGLLVVTSGLLGGCAVKIQERYLSPALREPKDVPREKWSDALLIMEAMGISGQHDLPRELASAGPSLVTSLGAASVTGNSKSPIRRFQVAAWVPADLVGSPQEASDLVLRLFDEARLRTFPVKRSSLKVLVGRYPTGSGREYAKFSDIFKEKPVPFSAAATATPAIIGTGNSYGPIFIKEQFGIDSIRNDISSPEAMLRLSKALPEWIYIYHHDQDFPQQVPGQVINKGKVMYFIGK